MQQIYDVIIVGGGPAGLSAALLLGRCRRNVLLCDNGKYRNEKSHAMHGFLTRDGIDPAELRKIAREQLEAYPSVKVENVTVTDASFANGQFTVVLENKEKISSKKLLLATGLVDGWPVNKGAEELYGTSIFHCPYCDGWEMKDQPLAVFGKGELALELTLWSKDIVFCSDGSTLSDSFRERLKSNHVLLREEQVIELVGKEGILEEIIFKNGPPLKRRAIFFNAKCSQRSDLAVKLGCQFDENGGIKVGKYEATNVPGLFAAGDTTRDVFQAIVAASEGVEAAFAINTSLLEKEIS